MDCIQCGERKGFRKATATARMARPRPPPPPTREVRLAPCASGLGQCPAHPIIRAHVATRRPKTTAREGRWLQPPFFPSCCPPRPCPRVARQGVCPVRLANCAACSHTLNQASWHQDGARLKRLATAVALLQTERRRTPSGLASAAHVAFDRLASTSPIRPHVLLRS
jgi:hypothetical protein